MSIIDWVEQGRVPDALSRAGMRALSRWRLVEEGRYRTAVARRRQGAHVTALRAGPIAVHTRDANAQHYTVPPAFFERVLGPRLKYSCCYYDSIESDLSAAEEAMLALTAQRAGVTDGMKILDLGCGWGSLSLYLAEQLPNASITGVSNSADQRRFIEQRAAHHGIDNLNVITADINHFDVADRFDRVLSIEMFEHMSNYDALLARVLPWLKEDGRLFVHYFCHRDLTYPFVADGEANWMARYFFTGGIMPSFDLFEHFGDRVRIEQRWWVSGDHYQRTSNHWLERLDRERSTLTPVLQPTYGAEAERWIERWRMFFMAVAEMFGLNQGREWGVGHYLLAPQRDAPVHSAHGLPHST